jgi:hypothetical protein
MSIVGVTASLRTTMPAYLLSPAALCGGPFRYIGIVGYPTRYGETSRRRRRVLCVLWEGLNGGLSKHATPLWRATTRALSDVPLIAGYLRVRMSTERWLVGATSCVSVHEVRASANADRFGAAAIYTPREGNAVV